MAVKFAAFAHSVMRCRFSYPIIIRASFAGKAYFGNRHENFLLIEKLDGLNAPYVVAFNMAKDKAASADAIMFVVSAHNRPALPTNLPVIGMGTLVSLTVQGKPIIRPSEKGASSLKKIGPSGPIFGSWTSCARRPTCVQA